MPRQDDLPAVICLMGPTATGKTDLALDLHARSSSRLDIISVDSAMVYRGMDIGTAKPDPAVRARVPHALVDIRDPAEAYSAADFARDARALIADSRAAGRIPLLVGGTMLYYRALLQGFSSLPAADPAFRAALEAEAAQRGWPALHERLGALDPVIAERLHPNDAQRIQRALEVYQLTGRPLGEQQIGPATEPLPGPVVRIGIAPERRDWLHDRIARRFAAMMDGGLVEEVAALRARGDLHRDLPAMRAVGYRQVWDWLEGKLPEDDVVYRGVVATRQFARRQLTWLRRETGIRWVSADDAAVQNTLRAQLADVID